MNELAKSSSQPSLEATVNGYATILQNLARASAFEAMRSAPTLLEPGEQLWTVAQALRRDRDKGPVTLALTDQRVLVLDENTRRVSLAAARESLTLREWTTELMWGTRLTLDGPGGRTVFKQLLPVHQGQRIAHALGHPVDPAAVDLLGTLAHDPQHPPVDCFWELQLYRDRLIDETGRHLPFTGPVRASVDSAGNIEVTRGRNLASKAVFGTLFAPATAGLSYFVAGNAKHRQIDNRELFLLVEGPTWAYSTAINPAAGAQVRQFAQTVNVTARGSVSARESEVAPDPATAARSTVDQVRELAKLCEEGILTEEEFAAAKARVLGISQR